MSWEVGGCQNKKKIPSVGGIWIFTGTTHSHRYTNVTEKRPNKPAGCVARVADAIK